MDLSNYEDKIRQAQKTASAEVLEIFNESEAVFEQIINLKRIDSPVKKLPSATYLLTKECVDVLKKLETFVEPSDDIYYLQIAKLFNLVNNIQVYWSNLYLVYLASKQKDSDFDAQKELQILNSAMLEISRLQLIGELKHDYEDFMKKFGLDKYLSKRESTGCLGSIALMIIIIPFLTLLL